MIRKDGLAGADEAVVRNQLRRGWIAALSTERKELEKINDERSHGPHLLRMSQAVEKLFTQTTRDQPSQTHAVVILHDRKIIAERYTPGFSAKTPLLGYSMTKSVMNTLIGILIKQSKLSLHQPVRLEEWSVTGDPRAAITLDQLLCMSSGLAW